MPEESKEANATGLAGEMPPYPIGLFDWTDEQKEHWEYHGSKTSIKQRASHKLWNTWLLWVDLHNNEKLINMIAKDTEDKESDEFQLKQMIVLVIDRLGKVLGNTNIGEEVAMLQQCKKYEVHTSSS